MITYRMMMEARAKACAREELECYDRCAHNLAKLFVIVTEAQDGRACKDVFEQMAYLKNQQRIHLERAAAILEVMGFFNEQVGHCVNIETLRKLST